MCRSTCTAKYNLYDACVTGCYGDVCSRFLGNIKQAFVKKPDLSNLLLDEFFRQEIQRCQVHFTHAAVECYTHTPPIKKRKKKGPISYLSAPHNIKLMKGKALRKHSLHQKTAASVLLKLFISGNE